MPVVEAHYTPSVFDVQNIEHAKGAIVGPVSEDPQDQTEVRWEKETPWLAGDICANLALTENSIVVDYGCGIGRVAKEIIARVGCRIVGVDISASMRNLGHEYVQSERFVSLSPLEFKMLVMRGDRCTAAYACWSLQHMASPMEAIDILKLALSKDGLLYVLNERNRYVPTTQGWVNDQISIEKMLKSRFSLIRESKLAPEAASMMLSERSQIFLMSKS